MKQNNIGKIQILIAVVVAVYILAPDLVIGPVDDTALAAIAGIAEVVLGIMRAKANSEPERMSDYYGNCDNFESY